MDQYLVLLTAMKVLHCQGCNDLVVPATFPRFCACGRHAIWSDDERAQRIVIYDRDNKRNRAFVVAINQDFLKSDDAVDNIAAIAHLIAREEILRPSILRGLNSLIAKFRPGDIERTAWADTLPPKPPSV
jgi:hypothetical protein